MRKWLLKISGTISRVDTVKKLLLRKRGIPEDFKMGNVLSGDEKLSQFFPSYDKKPKGIVWIDEQFGYRTASKSQRKAYERKRKLYYDANKDKITRQRSNSLGAIIGDLYTCAEDLRGSYRGPYDENRTFSRSLIPRIKLNKDMPIKEDFQYSSNLDVYEYSQSNDRPTTSYGEQFIFRDKKDVDQRMSPIRPYNENDLSCEILDKPEENYFTKNFDECMKRLQIIEKEQEIMEADGNRSLNAYNFKKPLKRQMTPPAEDPLVLPPELESPPCSQKAEVETTKECQRLSLSHCQVTTSEVKEEEKNDKSHCGNQNNEAYQEEIPNTSEISSNDTSQVTKGWYSNLKKHFENEDQKSKETSCRVTGATLKSPTILNQNLDTDAKEMRHYFSRLVRSNRSLIDEELPDPDKVQNIRAMFQESLKSTLEKNFNNRFAGSLQNINVRPSEDQFARPKSAQGNTNDFILEFRKINKGDRETSSNGTQIYPIKEASIKGKGDLQAKESEIKQVSFFSRVPLRKAKLKMGPANSKSAYSEKIKLADQLLGKGGNRKFSQPKWSDTTSLSSGVSSDLSSYDTDAEGCSREEIEENTTDEEFHYEDEDKHYVQNETLEKIRSFGTSVTYFGGQMITCSVGPLLSPTTQAILEEIGEKYPNRRNFSRTFEEFYRKYTENNEPRKKKIGRTRSFGQNDVFHKPNILNDTEIEKYKNDLEMEIGIRKPSGKNQNYLKQKLVKSNSMGSRLELFEQEVVDKLNEILEAAVEMTKPEKIENDNTEENQLPKKKESQSEDSVSKESKTDCSPISESSPKEPSGQTNELLFGYGKEIFHRERKPDMEFEEFEVCETVEEKIEKLEEKPQSYRLTIQVNQDSPVEENEVLEEIVINEQEPLDSLEIYLKSRKSEENSKDNESSQSSEEHGRDTKTVFNFDIPKQEPDKSHEKQDVVTGAVSCDFLSNSSFQKHYNGSKWPVETTVMVDIQKNEQLTPKLITVGKSTAKTKTRSFKR